MRKFVLAGAAMALTLSVPMVSVVAQAPQTMAQAEQIVKRMQPRQGLIALPEAKATLNLGTDYDFYNAADARTILVDFWGNPPEAANGVLGMVMPAGTSPLSESWGAVITFDPSGYVSDSDAASTDYNELLEQMQAGEEENNKQRASAGYPAMNLIKWAEQPNYDKATHSVVWAQDLRVAGAKEDTLNYDVRTLGRHGVLSLNLISSMSKLEEVKAAAHKFAGHVKFDNGARYEDFTSGVDKEAEYGVGGLVAAGLGVAAAKKLGFFAILLKFLKPILIGLVAAFAVLKNKVLGLFGRNKDPLEGE